MSTTVTDSSGQTPTASSNNTTSGTDNAGTVSITTQNQATDARTRTRDRRPTRNRNGGIPNIFTGTQPSVNAVIGTRDQNRPRNSFESLHDAIMSYVSEKYTKGTDLALLIRDLEAIDISSEEPDMILQKDEDGKDIPAGIVAMKKFEIKLKSYYTTVDWKLWRRISASY